MTLSLVHGRLVLPCCQFAFVIWLVDEVGVLHTLEVTFVVDLKCLGIIRWLVILPTWCLFTGMFHFRTAFRIRTTCCLVTERTVFYTILFGPEWTELPDFDVFSSFPFVTDDSSWLCCSPSLTSTSLPGLTPVALFPPCILASSKLCILGLGTWTFPEVIVFGVVCFF